MLLFCVVDLVGGVAMYFNLFVVFQAVAVEEDDIRVQFKVSVCEVVFVISPIIDIVL